MLLVIVLCWQKAQSKKGKSAEKSPQEEVAPSPPGTDVAQLNDSITQQGAKVRDLKAAKANKVSFSIIDEYTSI